MECMDCEGRKAEAALKRVAFRGTTRVTGIDGVQRQVESHPLL